MRKFMRPLTLPILAASLLAPLPAPAQLNDGKPDPEFAVPEALNLPYALAFALDNNFAIRQAKERIRQQEGVVLEVRGPQIPNVSGSGFYSRNEKALDGSNFDASDRNWSYSIRATQLLFAAGGVSASVQSQKFALDAAVLALQAVINDALLDVRTRFYTVLLNRQKITVQEQNVELIQRRLRDVKNRYEAGTVSNFEVLRDEVALANAKTPLITARNDHRLAIEELLLALGFTNAAEANLTKIPEFLGTLKFTSTSFELRSALATAREKRPDLLRLRKLETAAEEGVLARRSNYYPNLSAFGSYDWRKNPGSNDFGDTLSGWTFGLQSAWNIFDGRATAGRVAQARSFLEQTKLAVAEAQLSVDVEVRRAISTFQQATELAEASKKVVEQAEEALRLANARYNAGTATQLDVLTSQVELTTARLNQLQAYYSYNVAVATTRKAMGLADEMQPTGELAYPTQ
ncbi:MAG: TolC family protein [Lacunisphaera sp.]|nr:TolC family protein [Lacunisphaera sp.]